MVEQLSERQTSLLMLWNMSSLYVVFSLSRTRLGSLIHSWSFSKNEMMDSGSWYTEQR